MKKQILKLTLAFAASDAMAGVGVGNAFNVHHDERNGYTIQYPKDWTLYVNPGSTRFDNFLVAKTHDKTSSLEIEVFQNTSQDPEQFARDRYCSDCAWVSSRFADLNGVVTWTDWENLGDGLKKQATFVMRRNEDLIVFQASVSPNFGGLNWVMDMLDSFGETEVRYRGDAAIENVSVIGRSFTEDQTMTIELTVNGILSDRITGYLRFFGPSYSRPQKTVDSEEFRGGVPVIFERTGPKTFRGLLSMEYIPTGSYRINHMTIPLQKNGRSWRALSQELMIPVSVANKNFASLYAGQDHQIAWRVEPVLNEGTSERKIVSIKAGEVYSEIYRAIGFKKNPYFQVQEFASSFASPFILSNPKFKGVIYKKDFQATLHWLNDSVFEVRFRFSNDIPTQSTVYWKPHFSLALGSTLVKGKQAISFRVSSQKTDEKPERYFLKSVLPVERRNLCGQEMAVDFEFSKAVPPMEFYYMGQKINSVVINASTQRVFPTVACVKSQKLTSLEIKVYDPRLQSGVLLTSDSRNDLILANPYFDFVSNIHQYFNEGIQYERVSPYFMTQKISAEKFELVSPLEWN